MNLVTTTVDLAFVDILTPGYEDATDWLRGEFPDAARHIDYLSNRFDTVICQLADIVYRTPDISPFGVVIPSFMEAPPDRPWEWEMVGLSGTMMNGSSGDQRFSPSIATPGLGRYQVTFRASASDMTQAMQLADVEIDKINAGKVDLVLKDVKGAVHENEPRGS
jgi:hypothetical protein